MKDNSETTEPGCNVIPFPRKSASAEPAPVYREGMFVEHINRVAELWLSLPDDHPMFDGGRRLLARMNASEPARSTSWPKPGK